jgi:hypothetical protein
MVVALADKAGTGAIKHQNNELSITTTDGSHFMKMIFEHWGIAYPPMVQNSQSS